MMTPQPPAMSGRGRAEFDLEVELTGLERPRLLG
ncbi:hypothetical protein ENSA5_66940 [Enhygromyxa salina]|uniref:Uncharacterized protein n=1 Tax=Enhygromyxa salina TaxID=215803 RepID=A0A2S9XBD7_9BACT|nr:hypothetical protein ENSA5_66940 [Enhygromyxa salina]